jgi:hypothetical protein
LVVSSTLPFGFVPVESGSAAPEGFGRFTS